MPAALQGLLRPRLAALLAVALLPIAGARADGLEGAYVRLPLGFESSGDGARFRFVARGAGSAVAVTATETTLALAKLRTSPVVPCAKHETEEAGGGWTVVRLRLVGADPGAPSLALEGLPGRHSEFTGRETGRWRRGAGRFARVEFSEVYPGVSVAYHGRQRELTQEFVVAPGARPDAIALAVEGAEAIEIDRGGDLLLSVRGDVLRLRRPVASQQTAGTRREVDARWTWRSDRLVGIAIAAWDRTRPLHVTPILSYTTTFGGGADDAPFAIAVGPSGEVYVAGATSSLDFEAGGTVHGRPGGFDVFVAKLDRTGTELLYSAFLGGGGMDAAFAITVDEHGNAYVAGSTTSRDFPVVNAAQATFGGQCDAFVAKLDREGATLVYSTYLGGSGHDAVFGIAVDHPGNAWVAGFTNSTDLAVTPGALPPAGGWDAFVARLDPSGSRVLYATYLGGSGDDTAEAIAVDRKGRVWVAGSTASSDFPTRDAAQAILGGFEEGFVTRLDPASGALVWSTYLGGAECDGVYGLAVHPSGAVYVTGSTASPDFPVLGAAQPGFGGEEDAFVARLAPDGSLVYSTFLGGQGLDAGYGIAVDVHGRASVTGSTTSLDFPVVGAVQPEPGGGTDAFVTRLDASGADLIWSTYLGGPGEEIGRAIALDPSGSVYVAGSTDADVFVTRLSHRRAHPLVEHGRPHAP